MKRFDAVNNIRCLAALIGLLMLSVFTAQAQPDDRIRFNDQDLWLSGGNIAWINFARDIGPGTTDLNQFDEIFQQLHDNGGNAMRIWLHTTGAATPAWDGSAVTGPGAGAIEDLRAILDLAWEHEIGLMLCLWSFDMLRISNGTTITDRAYDLLTDPALTQTYIDNALVPMVEELGDHPAVIAWEIFNEPEGMSNEHGWNFNRHVPMSAIQRFINLTAGAIHRANPNAQVTNGSWAFIASSDQTPTGAAAKTAEALTSAERQRIQQKLTQKYRHTFSVEETTAFYDQLHSAVNYNYYRDDRLLDAGGDPDGTLDFYTVHYYEWAGTDLSPFHHDKDVWGLTKPLVIAEFFMGEGADGNPSSVYGVHWQSLYETLYERGYAGALAWQWFNYPNSAEGVINWPRILDSTAEMFELYPAAVDVYPGLRIAYLHADPPGIEAGQSSELSWSVTGAASITLNGSAVDSVGTMAVAPMETTTYTLEVIGRDTGETLTEEVTVTVLDPDQVNRARTQPAVASTVETCCGDPLTADLAFDGSPNTRWSSEWEEDLADDDPDDEWIYVDLGLVLDIERIVLAWEAAYGAAYNLDVSFDGRIWTTIHEERRGNGGTEEITFPNPPAGRFVRMQGLERGTEYGYSLWEMEVYGTASALQPPTVVFSTPGDGAVLQPGTDIALTAEATDPDGTIEQVDFYLDDTLLGTATTTPFTLDWPNAPPGEHEIMAIATDDDGLAVSTAFSVFVTDTNDFPRYEAEEAAFMGDVTQQFGAGASNGSYLDMRDSGSISFDVTIDEAGEYLLAFGYNLAYDVPKHQNVIINDGEPVDVRFTGIMNTWLERGLKVPLQAGTNTITIGHVWGWMYFDYVGVSGEAINVAVDAPTDVPTTFRLEQNYPNPFNPQTVIAYTLPEAAQVQLEIFDVTGRRVAILVDGFQPAGSFTTTFDARHLASGVYLYRLKTDAFLQTKCMVLMR